MRQEHIKIWLRLYNNVRSSGSLKISLFFLVYLTIILSVANQIGHIGDPVLSLKYLEAVNVYTRVEGGQDQGAV